MLWSTKREDVTALKSDDKLGVEMSAVDESGAGGARA